MYYQSSFAIANVAKRNDTKKSDNMEDLMLHITREDSIPDYIFSLELSNCY